MDLKQRYQELSKRVETLRIKKEMNDKELSKHRDTIVSLGFDPDKVEKQVEAIRTKVKAKLAEIAAKLDEIESSINN